MRLTDALEQALRTLTAANGPRARAPEPAVSGEARPRDPDPAPAPVTPAPEPAAAPQPEPLEPSRVAAPAAAGPVPAPSRELVRLEAATEAIERLGLGYHLGSAVERVAAAAQEGGEGAPKLREAVWLIERYLDLLERRPLGADIQAAAMRLAREGDTIAGLLALSRALESSAGGWPEPTTSADAPESHDHSVTAAAAPGQKAEPEEPAAPEEPVAAPPAAPEPARAPSHVSIGRELLVTSVRALIVVVSVVAIVFALTLISDWK